MKKSLLNTLGKTCFNLAVSASSISAMGASQSYYRIRRGGYSANKPYIAAIEQVPFSTITIANNTLLPQNVQNISTIGTEDVDIVLAKGTHIKELIVIDVAVQHKSVFMALQKPGIDVVVIKEGGLDAFLNMLSKYKNLDAVHLISHAKPGAIQLAGDVLDKETLEANIVSFDVLNNSIKVGGDLLLYGCELASGYKGNEFLEIMSANTHIDIAASNDITGHENQNADWDLEIQKGNIDAQPLEDSIALHDFTGVLQFSGAVDFSSTHVNGTGSDVDETNDLNFNLNGKIMVVNGYYKPTYTNDGSIYILDGENTVKISFNDNEKFDINSISIGSATGTIEPIDKIKFYISSNVGDQYNGGFGASLYNRYTSNLDLSNFSKGITALYISADQDFYVKIFGINLTVPSIPSTTSAEVLVEIGNAADIPNSGVSVITIPQLEIIEPALLNLDANNELDYREYIEIYPNSFSNPATQAEVQTMVNEVNTVLIVVASAENNTLTQNELTNAGVTQTGLNQSEITSIQAELKIANPTPKSTAALQNIVDNVLNLLRVDDVVISNQAIEIYPNPCTDFVFISDQVDNALMYDAKGKQVAAYNLFKGSIQVSELPSGIYFIVLEKGNNKQIERILKN